MATTFLVNNDTLTPFVSGSAGLQVIRGTAAPNNGSPVGTLGGLQGNFVMDTTTNNVWYCTIAGASGIAQWQQVLVDPANFALVNGSNTEVFAVASGSSGYEAVNFTQLTNGTFSPSFASGSFTQPVSGVAATQSYQLTTLGQLTNPTTGFAQLTVDNTFTASQTIKGALSVSGIVTAASGTGASDAVTYGQATNTTTGFAQLAASNIFATNQTITGTLSVSGVASLNNATETAQLIAAAPASGQAINLSVGSVIYFTSGSSTNFSFNITANPSLNGIMNVGQTITCAILVTQGATAYYPTGLEIDGTAVTPNWQGGTAPTSGDANAIDVYAYCITKTASATYTVLASATKFG